MHQEPYTVVSFMDSAFFSTCRNSSVGDIACVNALPYYAPSYRILLTHDRLGKCWLIVSNWFMATLLIKIYFDE